MQGRLLPKYQGRYQAHPKDYWRDEFKIASSIGLDCIEFILDSNASSYLTGAIIPVDGGRASW